VGKIVKQISDWRRPLPRPVVLPDVPLTLSTVADVRDLVNKRLPPSYKSRQVWQPIALITAAAARGHLPAEEVTAGMRLVLQLEGSPCRPQ